jgi:hypothetical protein
MDASVLILQYLPDKPAIFLLDNISAFCYIQDRSEIFIPFSIAGLLFNSSRYNEQKYSLLMLASFA